MKNLYLCSVLLVGMVLSSSAQPAAPTYSQDFEKCAVDAVSDEFLILDGAISVKADGGNKFLELPGAPLDTFGLLFSAAEKANYGAQARVFGTGKGRRFPTFAVGLNGANGFKLQV